MACLTDLFGIATTAAGKPELRQGSDILGAIQGTSQPRQRLFGYYGEPGRPEFKIMVRQGAWKYIYMANGGREQLFDLGADRNELANLSGSREDVKSELRQKATAACDRPELRAALDGGGLRAFPFRARPRQRIYQFDRSRGVKGFPQRPQDVLDRP